MITGLLTNPRRVTRRAALDLTTRLDLRCWTTAASKRLMAGAGDCRF